MTGLTNSRLALSLALLASSCFAAIDTEKQADLSVANTYVPQEEGALTKQIMAADPGDTLVLSAGYTYKEPGTLYIEKDVTIMGEPPTAISSEESPGMVEIANTNSIPGQPNAFIYSSGSHAVRLRRINFKDTGESGKMCTVGINYVETPLNLTLTPLPVDGNDKGIKLGMDMGPIYQGEHVKLMTVGQCESPSVTNKLVFPGVVVPVTDGICTASAHVYVPVASVAGCGLKSSNEDTLGSYEVPITVKVEEEVWHQSKDVGNQAALMRETSAEISLSFTLNEETKILAQCYETSAVPIAVEDAYSLVNMVDIKRITTNNNDSDMSEATLSFRVPAPYTLTGGDAENYTLEEDCTASPCVQKSTYNISGCRLGGLSHFTYPIKCQEGAADCPSEPATSIEVAVNVIMNSFCELTFKDIFETTQVLYTDDTYTTEREASDVYKVKDQICQKLSYLPKEHPDVSSNEIVMLSVKSITREVLNDTAECEDWDGTASMGQAFQVVPPGGTINYCFSVSNKMSCPIINGDGLNPMNVTTTVEFEYNVILKSTGLARRRRGTFTQPIPVAPQHRHRRSEKEEVSEVLEVSVEYTPPVGAAGGSSGGSIGGFGTGSVNDTIRFPLPWEEYTEQEQYILLGTGFMVIFSTFWCCCCCCCAFCVRKLRGGTKKKTTEKTDIYNSNTQSFATLGGQSQMF